MSKKIIFFLGLISASITAAAGGAVENFASAIADLAAGKKDSMSHLFTENARLCFNTNCGGS